MRLSLQAFRQARRGIAAVEFALLAPVLILLVLGIADLGLLIHERAQLSQVLTAGAQYAFRQGQTESGSTLTADVTSFIGTLSPVTLSSLSATYNGGLESGSCYCVYGSSPVYTGPLTCGATCTDSSGSTAGKFVAITAEISPTPLFSLDAYFMPDTLSATVTVRLQ